MPRQRRHSHKVRRSKREGCDSAVGTFIRGGVSRPLKRKAMVNYEDIPLSTKLVTRDGREVIDWYIIEHPEETFFPIRALVRSHDGEGQEMMPFTRSGRRYINVKSGSDLMILNAMNDPVKRQPKEERLDTMPDPIKAIAAVKRHDINAVRRANKDNMAATASDASLNYEIGSL